MYEMSTLINNFDENLFELIDRKEIIEVINLKNCASIEERSRFLWAWPTVEVLEYLKIYFTQINIKKILSVGCGSGLLEWLLQEYCGLEVYGLELDQSWWSSPYAPKKFINLNFTNCDKLNEKLLTNICHANDSNQFALLFCYFNNGAAFRNYIRHYNGSVVIIIGPVKGSFIYTDPEPFHPCFSEDHEENDKWKMISVIQIANSCNYISIWTNKID